VKASLGISDKLLLAAYKLENTGKIRFSAEDLVVTSWKMFPDAFGLKGYSDTSGRALYPDSNRVYVEIMGSKPLRKKGLLKKVGEKLYQLTDAGRTRVRSISQNTDKISEDKSRSKSTLARGKAHELIQLFESRAAKKNRRGDREDISFYDACGFWGISPRSNAKDLWTSFSHVEDILKSASENLGTNKSASARHGGIPYTSDDIVTLEVLHKTMKEKFSNELQIIKNRIDERK